MSLASETSLERAMPIGPTDHLIKIINTHVAVIHSETLCSNVRPGTVHNTYLA